jgi:Phosphotransferase enzyme family
VPDDVLPDDPTSIDAAWMQHALATTEIIGTLTNVEFAGYIGTGQMGRNARYTLTWDDPTDKPASIVGKFPTDDPTGRASGFASSYQKEFTFYTELASTVNVRAPKCYVARFDEPGQNFVLLMEDLAGSAQGDQMRGLNESEAELAVEQAVALHAPRWGDPKLLELTFGEVRRTREETRERLQMIYNACFEPTLARLNANLPANVIDLVREFAPHAGAWVTASDAPATMLHMDFRPDNFLFGVLPGAPPLAIVDWQTVTAGPGTHDLAYMIGGSFEPEQRTRVERDLVKNYCDRLAIHDIQYAYNKCWLDYRVSSLWGVIMSVIATMLASQTERGDLMLTTMLRRHGTHALELDALSLIRGKG